MLPAVANQTLPGLVQRAASQLASATSAAEVLEARDTAAAAYTTAKAAARLAKAKGAHDELIAKAHRAQAHALEIEAMAKLRLADEYDAAQERGDVAGHGGGKSNLGKAKVNDIDLSYDQIHEARKIKAAEEAEPGVIRRTLDALIEEGAEPTKAAVRRAIKSKPKRRFLSDSGKQLEKLRRAWREASEEVRNHFLVEITERQAA